MGKGEIARYEQFLLFPQCFQKVSVVDASKGVSMEQRVKETDVLIIQKWTRITSAREEFLSRSFEGKCYYLLDVFKVEKISKTEAFTQCDFNTPASAWTKKSI